MLDEALVPEFPIFHGADQYDAGPRRGFYHVDHPVLAYQMLAAGRRPPVTASAD